MRLTHRPDLRAVVFGSTTLLACSTPATDGTAPTLVAASFTDAQTLRLTFSEPMANPGTVDTQAFRLSIGVRDVGSTVYYALDYDGLYDDSVGSDDGGPISDGDPTADPTLGDPTGATSDATSGDPTDTTTGPDPTGGGYDSGPDPDGGYEGGYAEPGGENPGSFTRPIPTLPISDLDVTAIAAVASDARQIDLTLATPVGDTFACDALVEFAAESLKSGIFVHYKPGANPIADAAGNPVAPVGSHWVDARAKAYAWPGPALGPTVTSERARISG
jgi:hypothetical protein